MIKLNKIKLIFPNEFSMSELQNSYEQLLNEKFDRRNFRKKFIKQDLIEETGLINEYTNGRPAKLYKFKEKEGNITLTGITDTNYSQYTGTGKAVHSFSLLGGNARSFLYGSG